LTSLVLPNLSEAHWIARSAFLLSLVSGCLAVYYASLLQRNLGNFRTPEQVREWWRCSRGAKIMEPEVLPFSGEIDTGRRLLDELHRTLYVIGRSHVVGQDKIKLQASVAAAILMSSPSMMINYALGAFLTGIGVYLGFVWKKDLDTLAGSLESRNVFVCFLISLGFCYSFYVFPSLSKLLEDNRKSFWKKYSFERFDRMIDSVGQVIDRTGGLCRLGRISEPDMLTKLLSHAEKLAIGVRLSDPRDDRSNQEITKLVDDINALLTNWKLSPVDEVMKAIEENEGERTKKDGDVSGEVDKSEGGNFKAIVV
jgi:hypothetical protein